MTAHLRPVTSRPSQRAVVKALLEDGFVWDAAERLEALAAADAHPARGGRPRAYPLVCALIYDGLVHVFGSARQVEVELACDDSKWWDLIRRAAVKRAGVVLPEAPMRRHHYSYLRNRYLTALDDQATAIADAFTAHAAQLAIRIGLCDPDGGGSLTHPDADRVVAGDGKVVTPRYKTHPKKAKVVNKKTGEVKVRRVDPDAALHVTGGGDRVFGTKFVLHSTRGDHRNQRIILSVDHSAGIGGEAKTAIDAFDRVLPHLPGAQAVVYDGALRGTHLHHLIRNHGIIPIARVHRAKGGEKNDRYLGQAHVHDSPTRTTVEVHLLDGAPHVRTIAVDGTPHLHPLERTKLARRGNPGNYRLYGEYRLPDHLGGGTTRLRLDRTAEDETTGFNREEHLRPIPPADPDHARLYGRRNDTESGNRLLDDSMLRERAHTVGWRRQLLNLTTWAALRNASAVAQHTQVEPDAPPGLAA